MPAYSIKPTVPLINRRLAKLYGVVAAWGMTERGGVAQDSAGRRGSTVTGSPVWGRNAWGAFARLSSSAYYTVAHDAAFNFSKGVSFACWFQATATGTTPNCYLTTKSENSWYLGIGPTATLEDRIAFYLQGVGGYYVTPSGLVVTGRPVFGVATYDGANAKIYVDGVLVTTTAATGTISTGTSPVLIGQRPAPNAGPTSVDVSGLVICSQALSAAQVRALYLDPWALYRPDNRSLFAVSSSVLFRRSLSARAGSRSLSI